MSSESLVKSPVYSDPVSRIDDLISGAERKFRLAFMGMVSFLRSRRSIDEIASLLATGRVEEALREVENAARMIGATWSEVFTTSGNTTAIFFGSSTGLVIDFDRTSSLAVREMSVNQFRLINQITSEQIAATRTALIEGLRRNLDARVQADLLLRSIGLTSVQVTASFNYRRLLESLSAEVLRRDLRNPSYDSLVREAISVDEPLTSFQVERMVRQYEKQQLAFRADLISASEAQSASGAGVHEMYRQAVDRSYLDPNSIERTWHTRNDNKVRDPAHTHLKGQVRDFFTPFRSGIGGNLQFPGDPSALANDRAGCRCRVSTQFRVIA